MNSTDAGASPYTEAVSSTWKTALLFGQRVRIRCGILSGLTGTVVHCGDEGDVLLRPDYLDAGVSIRMSERLIEVSR